MAATTDFITTRKPICPALRPLPDQLVPFAIPSSPGHAQRRHPIFICVPAPEPGRPFFLPSLLPSFPLFNHHRPGVKRRQFSSPFSPHHLPPPSLRGSFDCLLPRVATSAKPSSLDLEPTWPTPVSLTGSRCSKSSDVRYPSSAQHQPPNQWLAGSCLVQY